MYWGQIFLKERPELDIFKRINLDISQGCWWQAIMTSCQDKQFCWIQLIRLETCMEKLTQSWKGKLLGLDFSCGSCPQDLAWTFFPAAFFCLLFNGLSERGTTHSLAARSMVKVILWLCRMCPCLCPCSDMSLLAGYPGPGQGLKVVILEK